MEFIDNILSGIYVIVGTACVIVLIAIFMWSKSVIGDIETRGSSIALAEKLLSAPCMNMADAKGSAEKFVFSKAVLDKYNNKPVCGGLSEELKLQGTTYHIEIKSSLGTWRMKNMDEVYAYNTHARGITKGCISDRGTFPFIEAASFKAGNPSPYDYNGNVLHFSGIVKNNDEAALATIKVIIDADSGTDYYLKGYPLCLCDVECPYDTCICSKKCDKAEETVERGNTCT